MLPTEISNSNSNSIFVLSIYGIKVKLLWLHFVGSDTNDLVGSDAARCVTKVNMKIMNFKELSLSHKDKKITKVL